MNHSGILSRSKRQGIFDRSNHPETPERSRSRRTVSKLEMVGLLVLMLAVSACSTTGSREPLTPLAQAAQYRQLYVTTLESLVSLAEAGLITPEQVREIEPIRESVRFALDDLEAAALAGDDQTFQTHLRRVAAALDRLIIARIQAAGRFDTGEPS